MCLLLIRYVVYCYAKLTRIFPQKIVIVKNEMIIVTMSFIIVNDYCITQQC